MHGTIQLAMTKAEVLASDGLRVQQLIDSAIRLCTRALQAPSPGAPATRAGKRQRRSARRQA